jgi:hypothetical protein
MLGIQRQAAIKGKAALLSLFPWYESNEDLRYLVLEMTQDFF